MANYAGPNFPDTDTSSIPVYLPRNRRNDQQPSIYVVSVYDGLSTTDPRVEIIPINARIPSSPPDTPPTDSYMHPAYYPPATGTIPNIADKPGWAETPHFVPGQKSHRPDEQPAKPTEKPTDFSTLSKLLDEIRQTQQCSHCQPPHRAKVSSVKVHPPSTLCYYHRQFGRAAVKCRTPCSQAGQQPRSKQ